MHEWGRPCMGYTVTAEETQNAEAKRNEIATAMWESVKTTRLRPDVGL